MATAADHQGPEGRRGRRRGDVTATNALLEVTDLSARYGQIEVLHGITFTVPRGEVIVWTWPYASQVICVTRLFPSVTEEGS